MDFFGKVTLLQPRTGTSKNGTEWVSYPFSVKDPNGTQEIMLEAFGDRYQTLNDQGLVEGAVGTVRLYCSVREYNGRRFNEIRPTGFTPVAVGTASTQAPKAAPAAQQTPPAGTQAPATAPATQPAPAADGDLPF